MAVVPAGPVGGSVAASAAVRGEAGTVETAEFLDVDVDQLAGMATAVTVRGFGRLQARKPVESEADKHRAHCRGGQIELAGDPCRGPTKATELLDDGFDLRRGPARDRPRGRGPVRHRLAPVETGQPAKHGPGGD